MKITVVKEFEFESAHFLLNYVGACANLHGHTYKLQIGVTGEPINNGMVIDFKDIKAFITPYIAKMDHALLNELHRVDEGFPKQTTAENMVMYLVKEIQTLLPKIQYGVELTQVRLWETRTSYAEWRANENS